MAYTGEKPHKCSDCGKQFRKARNLKTHMTIHTGEKPHKCSDCGKQFRLSSNLANHRRTHTGERPYKCSNCGKRFIRAGDLKKHMGTHTGEKPHKCSDCGKQLTTAGSLKRHMTIHTGEKPYKCSECGKQFRQAGSFKVHRMIHTGDNPCKCSVCGKQFVSGSSLKVHMMIHMGEKPYKCCQCGKQFIQANRLKMHKMTHTRERIYKCSECGKQFQNTSYLDKHMVLHTGEKAHSAIQSPLEEHVTSPTEDTVYTCSFCDKQFSTMLDVCTHMHTHKDDQVQLPATDDVQIMASPVLVTPDALAAVDKEETQSMVQTVPKGSNEACCSSEQSRDDLTWCLADVLKMPPGDCKDVNKLNRCFLCSRTFVRPSELSRHIRTHYEEKRYKCSVCRKQFMLAVGLKTHMLTHTGEKRQQCFVCNMRFTQLSELKTHMEVHTNEDIYKCSVCSKWFLDLEEHMMTHTGATPVALAGKTHMTTHVGGAPVLVIESSTPCQFTELRTFMLTQGSNPYKSSDGVVTFQQVDHLKRDKVTHTREKSHKCSDYGKQFPYPSSLKTHMKTHVGKKCSTKGREVGRDIIRVETVSSSSNYANTHDHQYCRNITVTEELPTGMPGNQGPASSPDFRQILVENGTSTHSPDTISHNNTCTAINSPCIAESTSYVEHPACEKEPITQGRILTGAHKLHSHRRQNIGTSHSQYVDMGSSQDVGTDVVSSQYVHIDTASSQDIIPGVDRDLEAAAGTHVCVLCGGEFDTWDAVVVHLQSHNVDKPHRCSQCEAAFVDEADLNEHSLTHHTETLDNNSIRHRTSSVDSGALRHTDVLHSPSTVALQSLCLESDAYGRLKQTKTLLGNSTGYPTRLHGAKILDKTLCQSRVGGSGWVSETTSSVGDAKVCSSHRSQPQITSSVCATKMCSSRRSRLQSTLSAMYEELYQCVHCNTLCSTQPALEEHMVTHTKHTPHRCTRCGGEFNESAALLQHVQTHLFNSDTVRTKEEKHYRCSVCGRIFNHTVISPYKHILNHMVTVESDRLYQCSLCNKKFTILNIKAHMMTHTGEKPHVCSVCRQTFIYHGALQTHMSTHSPCVCSVCLKMFAQSSDLKMHMRMHRGRSHTCAHCGEVFYHPSSLKLCQTACATRHTQDYSSCGACIHGFTSMADLENHLIVHWFR